MSVCGVALREVLIVQLRQAAALKTPCGIFNEITEDGDDDDVFPGA